MQTDGGGRHGESHNDFELFDCKEKWSDVSRVLVTEHTRFHPRFLHHENNKIMMRRSSTESTLALQRLFAWVEKRFGGLPMDEGAAAEVITTTESKVSSTDLQRLLSHQATALHVRGFYPKAAAKELGRQLTQEYEAGNARNWKVSTSRGLESSDVSTLGAHDPFNIVSASGNPNDKNDYFD
jgi:hypothetical protein